MTPEDYECRACHQGMYVLDGMDPLEEDVRFCSDCMVIELERLQQFVSKCCHTADDVPIAQIPEEFVWRTEGPEGLPQRSMYFENGMAAFRSAGKDWLVQIWRCYSTKEAAEKARTK